MSIHAIHITQKNLEYLERLNPQPIFTNYFGKDAYYVTDCDSPRGNVIMTVDELTDCYKIVSIGPDGHYVLEVEPAVPAEDFVNHPSHYTQYSGLEIIDLTEQMNFNRGNAVKYICRAAFKGSEIEDLKKAAWYIQREIDRVSSEQRKA